MADSNLASSGEQYQEWHYPMDQSLVNLMPEFGPNAVRNAEMHRLREAGWTYAAIGRFFGVSAFSARQGVGRHARPPMRIFGLSVRASNQLRAVLHLNNLPVEAPTLEIIATLSYQELLSFPCLGSVCAAEIAAVLWQYGVEMTGMPRKLAMELRSLPVVRRLDDSPE